LDLIEDSYSFYRYAQQADKDLSLAQSAVSGGLKHLEGHLGVLLFDCSNGLIGNAAGRQFYPLTCVLLEQAEHIKHCFQHYLPLRLILLPVRP